MPRKNKPTDKQTDQTEETTSEGVHRVGFLMKPKENYQMLEDIAFLRGCSVSDLLNEAVQAFLDDENQEEALEDVERMKKIRAKYTK